MIIALIVAAFVLLALSAGITISHVLTVSWSRSGESIAQTVTASDSGELNRSLTVPPSTSDVQVECPIDVDKVKSLYIHSDQTVTFEYNDNAGAQGSFTVTSNVPVIWYTGIGHAIAGLLLADVTSFYISNAGGTEANVRIRIIEDNTP